jgi:hypothetical protein
MVDTPDKQCDVDDLLCQVQVLGHLRGIKGLLGDEQFAQKFPEFDGLSDKLKNRVAQQEITVTEAMERCGLPVESTTGAEAPPADESTAMPETPAEEE